MNTQEIKNIIKKTNLPESITLLDDTINDQLNSETYASPEYKKLVRLSNEVYGMINRLKELNNLLNN